MRLVTLVAENRWRLLVLVSVCVFTLRGGCGRGALGFVFPGPALRWNTFCHQRLHGEWRWGNECKKSYSCSCSLDSRLDNSGTISIRKSVYGATTGRKRKGYTPGLSAFILPYDHISDGELYTAKNSFHLFGTKHGRIRQMGRQAREAWWWVRRRGVSTASAIVLMIAVIFSSPAQSRAGLFEFLEGDIYVNSPHRLAIPKIPDNLGSQLQESKTDHGRIFLDPDDYKARESVKYALRESRIDKTNYRIPGDEKILDPMHIATKDLKHTPVEDIVYERLWRETSGLSGMYEVYKIPTIVKTLIAIPICTGVLVKVVMFFINFANEIADEEEIELYGKVVPVSAIEKPTPPEGEDYEWADENDWAPPVHENEDGADDWPLPDGPGSWDGPRGSGSDVGGASADDLLS